MGAPSSKVGGKSFSFNTSSIWNECGPKIMTAIMQSVLGCNEAISTMSSSYINDIIVARGNMNAAKVKAHLESCGL